MPLTQGNQGNSENFQIVENLRETQGDSVKLRKLSNYRKFKVSSGRLKEVLTLKKSMEILFLDLK